MSDNHYDYQILGLLDPRDNTVTTWNLALEHPPHIGLDSIHFRWFGARRLLASDNCAAIIALMTPLEILIAQARIEGLPDTEIAERMHITPNAITQHMARLRRRIWHQLPDLRPLLAGRRYRSPNP